MSAEDVPPPIFAEKYLSSFHRALDPNSRASYAAFTELSLSEKATLDGYIQALAPMCGGWLGAWELLSKLSQWLAIQRLPDKEAK